MSQAPGPRFNKVGQASTLPIIQGFVDFAQGYGQFLMKLAVHPGVVVESSLEGTFIEDFPA